MTSEKRQREIQRCNHEWIMILGTAYEECRRCSAVRLASGKKY